MKTANGLLNQFNIKATNNIPYRCTKCKDTGLIPLDESLKRTTILLDLEADYTTGKYEEIRHLFVDCECQLKDRFESRMNRSGLNSAVKNKRFDDYKIRYSWQKDYRQRAVNFFKKPKQLFFMSGQSGSGKTLLCSALCNMLAMNGWEFRYKTWEELVRSLNNNYRELPKEEYKVIAEIPLLYLDDFLKTPGNNVKDLTKHEKKLARSLINDRYNNPNVITVISTELSQEQLNEVDESMFTRLFEMATKDFMLIGSESAKDRNIRYLIANGQW